MRVVTHEGRTIIKGCVSDSCNWFRSYGNENWEFDDQGYMRRRIASINDLPIEETDRNGLRRPDDHPSLSGLGL